MRFTPKAEEELNTFKLLPEGMYPFRVIKSEDMLSNNGNDMIKITLLIFHGEGKTITIYDYLLEKLAYKLRHFCESVGILEKYQLGILEAHDCESREGYVHIKIEKGKEKPEGGNYPDKNVVKDYVTGEKKEYVDLNKLGVDPKFNDVIPF